MRTAIFVVVGLPAAFLFACLLNWAVSAAQARWEKRQERRREVARRRAMLLGRDYVVRQEAKGGIAELEEWLSRQ